MTWFVNMVLPGLITTGVFLFGSWLMNRKTRRHVDTVTEKQTVEVRKLTAAQTQEIKRDVA